MARESTELGPLASVCRHHHVLRIFFIVNGLLLLFLLPSVLAGGHDRSTFVVITMDAVILSANLLGSGLLLGACRRYGPEK